MLQSEVIQPLETTRNKIKEQLSTVQEYRLLLALEKCIAQIPDISNDTMTTLERVRVLARSSRLPSLVHN